MLKLSVLMLAGTRLSFPKDFLHQKFIQLLCCLRFGIVVKCKLLFQLCTLYLLKLWQQRIVMLCNKMWKPTLFNIKKGQVSNLFCFLFFLKSLFADQQPVLFMGRVLGAFFYGFTGIINHGFLTNHIARTISVIF